MGLMKSQIQEIQELAQDRILDAYVNATVQIDTSRIARDVSARVGVFVSTGFIKTVLDNMIDEMDGGRYA